LDVRWPRCPKLFQTLRFNLVYPLDKILFDTPPSEKEFDGIASIDREG